MTAHDDLDFSITTVPDEWTDASKEAPGGEKPDPRKKVQTKVRGGRSTPSRHQTDIFSAGFLGTAVAIISGVGWYFLETMDPGLWWAPAVVALLIGLGVRLAGGNASPGITLAVSSVIFSVTVFVTGVMIARHGLSVQGASKNVQAIESQLIFIQFTALNSWLGLFAGFLAMSLTSFGGGKRS